MVGIDPRVRLPNRFVDGYGLSPAIVAELAAAGANVIVTADCGSTSHDAATLARELGVDLIITDHHQCPTQLPDAYALVNPWRPDCEYPCDYLCGAGVAFKLMQALADALLPDGRAAMEPLLDLVAVATVADIMPLLGENRRLVLAGLRIMNAFPRPGVRALIETSGLKPGEVDAAALGFRVAPRVNAAGRLDDPNLAYRLLMSESYEEAFELAAEINRLNEERQALTRTYTGLAHELVQTQFESGEFALVCGGDDWPSGIVGLVAGKLAQAYNRPTLVYRRYEGMVSGSGRSIPGFNLLGALQACDDVFDRYGGHQAAAGFSLSAERLDELIERFQLAVRETLPAERLEPILWIDGYLKPETICYDFARSLEQLAPFGAGLPVPDVCRARHAAHRKSPARDRGPALARPLPRLRQRARRGRLLRPRPTRRPVSSRRPAGHRLPPEAHPLRRLLASRDGAPRRSARRLREVDACSVSAIAKSTPSTTTHHRTHPHPPPPPPPPSRSRAAPALPQPQGRPPSAAATAPLKRPARQRDRQRGERAVAQAVLNVPAWIESATNRSPANAAAALAATVERPISCGSASTLKSSA